MSFASSHTSKNSKKCRIVFLGDMGVGKTSVIQKFTTGRFDEANNSTVGIDFNKRDLKYKQQTYRLQMWDTAGQQRYQSLIPNYLKNANYGLLVFDVTRTKSLESIEKWFKLFREYQQSPCILIGNKSDLDSTRKVTKNQAQLVAKKLGMEYIEVSAKTGKKIDQVFQTVVRRLAEVQQNKKDTNSHAETVDTLINQEEKNKIKLGASKNRQKTAINKGFCSC